MGVCCPAGNSNAATCDSEEAKALREAEKARRAIDQRSTDLWVASTEETQTTERPSRRQRQQSITDGAHQMEQQRLEDMMCESFCTSHLPWVVADHPDFRAFLEAVNRSKTNFRIPHRQKLSTGILARVESKWDSAIEKVKSAWDVTGVTIACDGWTDAVGRSIVVVIALGGDAPVLLDIVNAELDKKTGQSYTHKGIRTISLIHNKAHIRSVKYTLQHKNTVKYIHSQAHSLSRTYTVRHIHSHTRTQSGTFTVRHIHSRART